jgi:hypothetical protein
MPAEASIPSQWRTSSDGAHADTLPFELADLGAHLGKCRHANGHLVILQGAWHAATGFMHARLVTTLLGLAALSGGLYLVS